VYLAEVANLPAQSRFQLACAKWREMQSSGESDQWVNQAAAFKLPDKGSLNCDQQAVCRKQTLRRLKKVVSSHVSADCCYTLKIKAI
jgi:hypothetical protein